ncbi:hypothetical protein FHR81_002010 [Actinoalloteichus hoggarensis]|uniref:Uncharacterized protein n=1 Tax=Actinoalloteichus hoggarensis TaxID=1470176 RepID=A0A221W5Q8_9PSEU|nr:SMI1/KNR4 family protein [Actinoalloteichus hoggarensis]ASO21041.1 hypothetical protein AHOG_17075 [Actinoalloteichus hoggarensis]MBB5920972.1 hypothetical protein [Actinoalloteichus hoggarensis]
MDIRSAGIIAKLSRARADPRLLTSFGAKNHEYTLNAPSTESTVAAFEAEHGITLPDGYRRFLLEVGDGGAGPSYGLLRLSDAYAEVSDSFPGALREPSPFVPGAEYGEDWWDDFWGPDDRPDPLQGTLAVVHHGCADYTQLVVTGPGRGRLVNVNLDGSVPPYVLEDRDFLDWYERWLDELLAGHRVAGFGAKLPGDEATLIRVLAADPAASRRARAATSLAHLARLSPAAVRALATATTDPAAIVRTAALGVAWRAGIAIEDAARNALSDPEAAVRAEAISVLRVHRTSDLAARATAQLADDDRDLIHRALWALADSGELTSAAVAPLLDHTDHHIRGSAAARLVDARDSVIGALDHALRDGHPRVRLLAVQTADRRDERGLLPRLAGMLAAETDEGVLINLRRVVGNWTDRPSTPDGPAAAADAPAAAP